MKLRRDGWRRHRAFRDVRGGLDHRHARVRHVCATRACAVIVLAFAASAALAQKTGGGPSGSTSRYPPAFQTLVQRAETARESDRTDDAIRLYRQAVRTEPDYVQGWWYLGTLEYDADRYSDGASAFQQVTALKPLMSLGWAMWGLCEFETKHYDSALVHLARADQLGIPGLKSYRDVARYHLALLLTRAGQYDDAFGILADFSAHGQQNPELEVAMGLAALRMPLLPAELPSSQRELVLDVGHAMGDGAARRATDVRQDVSQLLARYPQTPQIHFLVGNLELSSGNSDQALEEWKKELAITPGHPQALVGIAVEYMKRGEYKTALPYAEKAVAADPRLFTTHAVLGQVLSDGNLDLLRAIKQLEIADRLAPTSPQVRFALAKAYAKAGRTQDAARERAEFLKLRAQQTAVVSKSQ